jgi:hypothetical protein
MPRKLVQTVERKTHPSRRDAVTVQIAVAIEILLMAPLRIANLARLRLDHDLLRPAGAHGLYLIALGDVETKTGEPYEYKLPRPATELIDDLAAILSKHDD